MNDQARVVADLLGLLALLGVLYLVIPWGLVSTLISRRDVTADVLTMAIESWVVTLGNNISVLVLLLLVATAILGPETMRIVLGGNSRR